MQSVPITTNVVTSKPTQAGWTRYNIVIKLPGIPVSSINKTDCQDITEILLKVTLNTINHKSQTTYGTSITMDY